MCQPFIHRVADSYGFLYIPKKERGSRVRVKKKKKGAHPFN
jgi:hypothetical protein